MYALLILLLILIFGYPYCIQFTCDNRYNTKSFELIYDRIKVSCLQANLEHLSKYKINHVNMNLLKNIFYLILGLSSF